MKKKIIVLVGNSGSGKTSVAKALGVHYGIPRVVTSTSRKIRKGEIDGVDYHFFAEEELLKRPYIEKDFYAGNYYATCMADIEEAFEQNDTICIVMTPAGCEAIQKQRLGEVIPVLVRTSVDELEKRLINRGDSLDSIQKRLQKAESEEIDESKYRYVLDNDSTLPVLLSKVYRMMNDINKDEVSYNIGTFNTGNSNSGFYRHF